MKLFRWWCDFWARWSAVAALEREWFEGFSRAQDRIAELEQECSLLRYEIARAERQAKQAVKTARRLKRLYRGEPPGDDWQRCRPARGNGRRGSAAASAFFQAAKEPRDG